MIAHYCHRVLEEHVARWTALGWRLVLVEDNSPSLRAQGQRVALIEWDAETAPPIPVTL